MKSTTGDNSAWKRSDDKERSGYREHSRHKERMVIKADTESTEDTKSAWSSKRGHWEARSSRSLRRGHWRAAIEKQPSRKTIEKRRSYQEAAIEKQSQRRSDICHQASGATLIEQRPSSSGHRAVAIDKGHWKAAIEKRPLRKTIEKRRGHREAAIKKQSQRPSCICHRASRAAAIEQRPSTAVIKQRPIKHWASGIRSQNHQEATVERGPQRATVEERGHRAAVSPSSDGIKRDLIESWSARTIKRVL